MLARLCSVLNTALLGACNADDITEETNNLHAHTHTHRHTHTHTHIVHSSFNTHRHADVATTSGGAQAGGLQLTHSSSSFKYNTHLHAAAAPY